MSDEDEPSIIAPKGNLVLDIAQEEGSQRFSYRVDSKTLQQNSRYFENLLSDRFSEGQQLSAALEALKLSEQSDLANVSTDVLPRISIVNVGKVAVSKASSVQNLVADFLRAIHGFDLAVTNPPVANLANLAVVADRFDAIACLSRYIQRKKYLQVVDAKSKGRANSTLTEERVRQKLLIGLLFDYPSWVAKYSKHMIMRDSAQWQPGVEPDHTKALWWDIPNGVEDELIQRREYILETVNSLQAHFLKLYTSGERQCKLGYDTSLQCDSFQLGEMVRFFHKIDTVRLQGKIYDNTEPTYYLGDIDRLLVSLRQCSNYQVDANHSHCGLRSRLLPLLDLVQSQLSLDTGSLDIGICANCWNDHRSEYAWSLAKRPVLWAHPRSLTGNRTLTNGFLRKGHQRTPSSCLSKHVAVRDLFMAVERDWTARDTF
ncbi:Nn.00g008640.m01.CDS01 [Neocucurbitaria sp. VM-36]